MSSAATSALAAARTMPVKMTVASKWVIAAVSAETAAATTVAAHWQNGDALSMAHVVAPAVAAAQAAAVMKAR